MSPRELSRQQRSDKSTLTDLPYMLKTRHLKPLFNGLINVDNPASIHKFRREMHYIDLPRFSLTYDLPYMLGLRKAIENGLREGTKPTPSARAFAGSVIAHNYIQAGEAFLGDRITTATNKDGLVHATDITLILNISNSTISDWRRRADVDIVQQGHKVFVAADTLREVCVWHRPESYDPTAFEPKQYP